MNQSVKKEYIPQIKYIANLFLIILGIVFVSFFYFGITTKYPVSLDYNVPIAKTILSGDFLHVPSNHPFMYFPGSSHVILAVFLLLGLPNLFGLLGLVFIFIVCKKLGDVFGLNRYMSIIFASSICTTISVIRTIGDQSIDKWLFAWFVLCVFLLEKPQRSLKFCLFLGFSLGMLIGTKYSGPLFFLAILPVYGKTLLSFLSPLRFLVFNLTFISVGLFWYIRNFILEGNPYYPANLPFLKGYPNYTQQDWMLWKIPFEYPQNIVPLLNAFLSEYMLWAFSGFVIAWFVVYSYRKKQSIDTRIIRVIYLAITTGLMSLLLPITPPYKIDLFHIISDMRYVYIVVALLVLAIFLIADKYKKNSFLATVSLINSFPLFSFLQYQPKIFVISIILVMVVYTKRTLILRKIYHL